MRKKLFLLFLMLSSFAFAGEFDGYIIDDINISSTRINTKVAEKKFGLKRGDVFSQKEYEDAQQKLHDLRVFKTLDFNLIPKPDNKLDIDVKGTDGYYVFPLAFVTGGSKSAFALSVAEGNILKQGESAFFFVGSGEDGTAASAAIAIEDNFFQIGFENLNFEQRFYKDSWSSYYGVFNTGDDKDEFGTPLNTIYTLFFLSRTQI